MYTNKAIFLFDKNPFWFITRGEAYLELCDLKSAIFNYRKAFHLLGDKDTRCRNVLSSLLDMQGNLLLTSDRCHASIQYFTEAITLDGLQPTFWLHRAMAYIQNQSWKKALSDLDHTVIIGVGLGHNKTGLLSPTTAADVLVLRGKVFWKLDMRVRGNEDFKTAHKLCPLHPEVKLFETMMWEQAEQVYHDASFALLNQDYGVAVDLLTSALALNPGDVKVLILRSAAHRKAGNLQDAMQDVDEASKSYGLLQGHKSTTAAAPLEFGGAAKEAEHPDVVRQRNLIYNEMALLHFQNREFHDALTLFNRIIDGETKVAMLDVAPGEVSSSPVLSFSLSHSPPPPPLSPFSLSLSLSPPHLVLISD
jgi:tetratricopeptide (TPR) repeat protein